MRRNKQRQRQPQRRIQGSLHCASQERDASVEMTDVEVGLAGGPGHVASAEEVEMEVVDGLSAVGAGVEDDAVAVGEVLKAGDFGGGGEEVAEEGCVGWNSVGERGDVAFGDDEDVGRGLGIDVGDGEGEVVLVEAG